MVLIWAALPEELRSITRPIAAKDYWTKTPFKQWITTAVFNAVYRGTRAQPPGRRPSCSRCSMRCLSTADSLESGDHLPRRHARPCGRAPAVQGRPVQPGAACSRGGAGARLDQQRAARDAQGRGGAGADPVLGDVWRADSRWKKAKNAAPSSTGRGCNGRARCEMMSRFALRSMSESARLWDFWMNQFLRNLTAEQQIGALVHHGLWAAVASPA
jgi:hypothetical protein